MRVKTTCPYCGVGCHLILHTVDGKVVAVSPGETGPGEGKICIKGWSAHEFIHSEDRLKKPLIKENNEFREATWEEALTLITQRLRETQEKHGSDSIGFFSSAKATNEDNYMLQKLARATFNTNNVDHCARLCHSSTVTGLVNAFGSGAMTNSQEDLEESDVIFITGTNTSEQHPLISRRMIRANRKGTKLIIADPREIKLAEYASVYMQQKPGTDVALLNALMTVIIEENLHDLNFIESRTEGFDLFKEAVTHYSPEEAEKTTGVPAEKIREAAQIIGRAERASIFFSMGITQHTTGVDNVMSCANLALLTGNIGKPGTGVNPLRGQNNVQGACDVGALPNYLPGYQNPEDPETRRKFKEIWKLEPPGTKGLTLTEMMNMAGEEIKALLIVGENPMISDPNLNHVKKQLKKLDFLAVSELFMSETAELADVVLPACSYAEKDGTFTATDRRVQRVRKAIEPLGDSKPDWWIFQEIARKTGQDWGLSDPEEILEELAKVSPIYGGLSFERLDEEDLRWPCRDLKDPGTIILHQGRFSRGLGKFHPVKYMPPAEQTDGDYPFILTTGRLLFHWHTGTMTRRSGTLIDQVNEVEMEIHPEDAEKLSIIDGEKVRVSSRRGAIELKAKITPRIKPGTVFIPFHYAEAAANKLTNNALDSVAKIPEFKACAVKIEKI
jgi:formate dehydrogenase alpha subunit